MATTDETVTMHSRESQRGPIEFREAAIDGIRDRIITVIAVPYETPALVEYRGQLWQEIFERSAFDGLLQTSRHRVRVNRGHDRNRTVGKVMQFYPRSTGTDGLVSDVLIANTLLGDETLELAGKDCLSASVAYGVVGDGQKMDRRNMTRRISNAWLEHIALVEQPAYDGAKVLSVREDAVIPELLPLCDTPDMDSAITEMQDIMEWSAARLKKQG